MAIAFILDAPGVTREQYEAAHRELGDPLAHGALVHIAGPTDGGWRVVEVWPTQDAADRFFGSPSVRAAFRDAAIPPVRPAAFPVHALYASPAPA